MLPLSGQLEKLANKIVPEGEFQDIGTELDERLLVTPPIAFDSCRKFTVDMAQTSMSTYKSLREFRNYSDEYKEKFEEYTVKYSLS